MVDLMLFPRNRMVAADDDLSGADLRYQVAERFGREYQRIEIELFEIVARPLLQLDVRVAILWRNEAGMVATRRVGAEIAAAMRGDDLQARETVERSFEDQMLQSYRRIERIADGVRQPAVALEAPSEFWRALRMDEQHRPKLFRFRPHRMKPWIGKILSKHTAADGGSAQALFLQRRLELLHGEVRILQRERGKCRKAIRARCAQFSQFFVLQLDDLGGRVAVLAVPERVDREHFHVDRLSIHPFEALLDDDEMLRGTFDARHHAACLIPHQSERLVEVAVRVHIDGLDPLAVHSHGQTLAIGPLAPRHIAHRAAAEHNARCACGLDKVAPRSHGCPLSLGIRVSCAFTFAARALRDSTNNAPLSVLTNQVYDVNMNVQVIAFAEGTATISEFASASVDPIITLDTTNLTPDQAAQFQLFFSAGVGNGPAGWHMSTRLVVPANITIIALPPKCPELNPVENVWQFMRDNWLSNRIFKSFDDIVDHCCYAWNKLVDQPWRIMSIGLRQWAHEF